MTIAPARENLLPNAPIREAFEESGLSAGDVARRIDWVVQRPRPRFEPGVGDSARLKRSLGLMDSIDKHGVRRRQTTINEETAAAIVEALGLFPADVGL